MFSALFRKEWRQLKILRWAGIALGAAIPAMAVAGAEAGARGWLPFGGVSSWTSREVFGELTPAILCLVVWPLLSLVFVSQAFTGDFASGTESFLLERPVSRKRVWLARLLAALASVGALATLTGGVALSVSAATLGIEAIDAQPMWGIAGAGLLITAVVVAAGLAAASFLRSPVGVVLLGLILAVVPAGWSVLLASLFPFATLPYSLLPVGIFIPWLLLPGFVAAAWVAATSGEPAGRGSRGRSVRVLGYATLAVIVVFAGTAAAALRSNLHGWVWYTPSPDGSRAAFAELLSPLRLVDTASGSVVRWLPPPVYAWDWSDDGSVLAVATSAGTLGSDRGVWRVEYLRTDGSKAHPPTPGDAETDVKAMAWQAGRIVVVAIHRGDSSSRLLHAAPGEGEWRTVPIPTDPGSLRLLGDSPSGLYLAVARTADGSGTAETDILHLGWDGSSFRSLASSTVPHWVFSQGQAASADGRFVQYHARISVRDPDAAVDEPGKRVETVRPAILDMRSKATRFLEGRAKRVVWLANERIAWVVRGETEQAIFTGAVEGGGTMLRAFAGASVHVEASPDGRRLLAVVRPRSEEDPMPAYAADRFEPPPWQEGAAPKVEEPEVWIADLDSGAWTRLSWSAIEGADETGWWQIGWVGNARLVRIAAGAVAFESLDRPGEYVWAHGGP